MDGNWIEFDERQTGRTDGYYITLNGDGEFLMNRLLFEGMERPEAVTLYFDPDKDRIGMRKADRGLANAFNVRSTGRSDGRIIRARVFSKKWDIRLTGTFSFPEPKIEDGMLVLHLNSRFNVSRQRQR